MAEAELQPDAIGAGAYIVRYLEENSPEWRKLADLRKKGWASPQGDVFFARQRQNADSPSAQTVKFFYQMMQIIARELDNATATLQIRTNHDEQRVLDFCAAPGGFLDVVLRLNPNAHAQAFSLPVCQGGHEMLMPKRAQTHIEFLDVTMLAEDMGSEDIPLDHPDASLFHDRCLAESSKFDLIICDGQVLRTHARAEYRKVSEARRLTAVQLALGLKHIRPGGTMLILLHHIEAWEVVATLFRFSKFSSIQTYKPPKAHAKRSSFYLIATQIQSEHPEAIKARNIWMDIWKTETFDVDVKHSHISVADDLDIDEVLRDFGQDLIMHGRPMWQIQARALARASFMKEQKRSQEETLPVNLATCVSVKTDGE